MSKRRIITQNTRQSVPKILKGITPRQLKQIVDHKQLQAQSDSMKIIGRKGGIRTKNIKTVSGTSVAKELNPRPDKKLLTNLATDVKRIVMPEAGSFNPGIVKLPNSDRYVMVYRPNEYRFIGCFLDKNLNPEKNSFFKFKITNCADPRLMWTPDNKLLMVYSSTTKVGLNFECIRGSIIMDLNKSESFIDGEPFRISPEDLTTRQKNWTPFLYDDKIYLIASICPHIVYEIKIGDNNEIDCEQKFETDWIHPWFNSEFLRGNTNPVRLNDGNYLSTFHTAVWNNSGRIGETSRCHYDNGCYLFEGKPPFRVLKCSNRTYLPAEGAVEPHFRNSKTIKCTFPVGMVRELDKLLISYGDNDSIVKIMKTTVVEMLNLMLDVY